MDNTQPITPQNSSETEAAIPSDTKRAFVSAGERVHKWSTYLLVDWVFNTCTGVAFSYWGKQTELGKKIWSTPLTKGFETALKPIIKDTALLTKSSEYGSMFVSLIMGGMFTIPPLLALENNTVRKKITSFYDRVIYGKERVDNDPKFDQAYSEIKDAPKKDFLHGLLSRFAALAPLLAIVLIPKTKAIADKLCFNHIERASEFVADKIGFTAEKTFKKLPLAEAQKRMKFIHESIAMDFGLGLPYAGLHAVFYNMFASHKAKKSARNDTLAPAVIETAPDISLPNKTFPNHTARILQNRAIAANTSITQDHGIA